MGAESHETDSIGLLLAQFQISGAKLRLPSRMAHACSRLQSEVWVALTSTPSPISGGATC